jgi:ribosome maturation factor RimP
MEIRHTEWTERLKPLLDEEGAELLETNVSRGRNSIQLRFFVDREAGIGVAELARLSRKIGMLLDSDPSLSGRYELEVSSPGMNRVVFTERHFQRFEGERVHVWTLREKDGLSHYEGTILGSAGGSVSVTVDGLGVVEFRLDEIKRAELRLDPRRPPRRKNPGDGGASDEVRKNGE